MIVTACGNPNKYYIGVSFFFTFTPLHCPPRFTFSKASATMTSKDLTALLAWAEENEIVWDKSAVEIKEGKYGLGLYAKKHLEEGYEGMLRSSTSSSYRLALSLTSPHHPF